jgi:protein subunit release factor B
LYVDPFYVVVLLSVFTEAASPCRMSGIRQDKWVQLHSWFQSVGIESKDLYEISVKSSGPGGQHLQKNLTAVRLVHIPTQISVKIGTYRQRERNRLMAYRTLLWKLGEHDRQYRNAFWEKEYKLRRRQQQQKKRRLRRHKSKCAATSSS